MFKITQEEGDILIAPKATQEELEGLGGVAEFFNGQCVIHLKEFPNTWLIAHELGHCLGLPHDSVFNSVMNPALNGDSLILTQENKSLLGF